MEPVCPTHAASPATDAAAPVRPAREAAGPAPLDSQALLGNRGEVAIVHEGETYRLRRTRQGKLILTK